MAVMTYIILHSIPCIPIPVDDSPSFRQVMATLWGQMAVSDPGVMASLFLAASRNLASRRHKEIYEPLAERYRGECLKLLRAELASWDRAVKDVTITKTLALATDAVRFPSLSRTIPPARIFLVSPSHATALFSNSLGC